MIIYSTTKCAFCIQYRKIPTLRTMHVEKVLSSRLVSTAQLFIMSQLFYYLLRLYTEEKNVENTCQHIFSFVIEQIQYVLA